MNINEVAGGDREMQNMSHRSTWMAHTWTVQPSTWYQRHSLYG